ncbi:hypothetical protein CB0940_05036 [Cercospora beticola]|uniref:Uncharacterized protein n=2 Tax=Cercospora TaxID=29002 RepID=A0A2G5HKA2_CERBT|nr:hypothetical protein CB0940_05036 [Cercospora beticola]XP_044658859.1 uncharacterized protein CKM354_000757000 [Cercospora kikuchii]PIA92991.1 hypothetical protein CB0940_05036 [Cercospora beticola]WPB02327.1 hypothetical protein RHO25_006961 [Cercospora beticola]CAK1362795.1 unnamed protein product [Cercospora beticola]GIZ44372.1 hypothetical protein CKM354_000757000 [Cercospora kikuchii]
METIASCLESTAINSYLDIVPEMLSSQQEETNSGLSSPTSSPSPILATDAEHPCTSCGGQRSRRVSMVSDPKVEPSYAGRTYHPCTNSRCRRGRANTLDREWHAWQVHGENPKCDCGLPSKQGRQEPGDLFPGYGIWECAFGSCKYRSRDRKGRSVEKGEVKAKDVERFIPWLLNGR